MRFIIKAKYTRKWRGKDGKWNYEYGEPKRAGISAKVLPSKGGVSSSVPSIKDINKLKGRLSESLYKLRKEMDVKPSEQQKALFAKRQSLLRRVPKTYTSDEAKARWYRSVYRALKRAKK